MHSCCLPVLLIVLLALISGMAIADQHLDPALVAWYGFEEIEDGRVRDLSGHGLDLQVTGTVGLGEGRMGQAAEFTGEGYLETPDHPLLALEKAVTLECWVWLPPEGSSGRLIDKGRAGKNEAYMLDLHPGSTPRFIARGALHGDVKLPPGQWNHVVATYNTLNGNQILYVNGKEVAGQIAYGSLSVTSLPLRLGADSQGTSQLRGRLDEVRVYSRQLLAQEVQARYEGREIYQAPWRDPVLSDTIALRDGSLQLDYSVLVGHNDVVYLTPALYPFEALPLGNGNLGVALWNQGGMYLKFNNGSFWRGDTGPMQCSSGEAQLTADPDLFAEATEFKQRLSLYEGAVYTRATTPTGDILITSFVAEGQDLVVTHVVDGRTGPVKRELILSHWRDDVQFVADEGVIAMTSDSGLPGKNPSLTGLPLPTTSVVAACVEGLSANANPAADKAIRLTLGETGPVEYTLYFAAPAVRAEQGDPLTYARNMLEQARQRGWRTLFSEHKRFWADFWSKSALYLRGPDMTAEYLAQLWYLNLYWAGCQSRGPYCPKFNGGNFLLDKDTRCWGGRYWWQNTRELFWCLPAANHPELVQPLFDLYMDLWPVSRQHAREYFRVSGLQVQETSGVDGTFAGGPYVFLVLTNGLETALQFYQWCQYTGNDALFREKVYPYMVEAVQFFLEYAKRGEDGKWHIYPTNSRETWWRVQDAAPDLAGLRVCLPILIQESQRLGRDAALRPIWQEFLDNLADFPTDPETGAYLPCVYVPEPRPTDLRVVESLYVGKNVSRSSADRKNSESPECEFIFPWNLSGIGSPNHEQARATFLARRGGGAGWDPSGVWAARLGLAEEALKVVLAHAGNQRWPQGWWNTPATTFWAKSLIDSPGFDSAGANATALTEMCLQSHDERVRLWPAFPAEWRGLLRLRAMPGFLVTSEILSGQVAYVVVESERGEECRLVNPWDGKLRVSGPEGFKLESEERVVVFPTQAGGTYVVESAAAPLSTLSFTPLKPSVNEGPRWPGMTSPEERWRPGQPIMIGLAKDGHPLRLRLQESPES